MNRKVLEARNIAYDANTFKKAAAAAYEALTPLQKMEYLGWSLSADEYNKLISKTLHESRPIWFTHNTKSAANKLKIVFIDVSKGLFRVIKITKPTAKYQKEKSETYRNTKINIAIEELLTTRR